MMANRIAAFVRDGAGDRCGDVEAILLSAMRASDAFQAIVVHHEFLHYQSVFSKMQQTSCSPGMKLLR